jgi:hypothetical protein
VRVECEIDRSYLTVVERRAPWRPDFGPGWTRLPIAPAVLYQGLQDMDALLPDRNLRFHRYDRIEPCGVPEVGLSS